MKTSKFTEEQIAFALKQAETGAPVKKVVRKMGITEQTFYRLIRHLKIPFFEVIIFFTVYGIRALIQPLRQLHTIIDD